MCRIRRDMRGISDRRRRSEVIRLVETCEDAPCEPDESDVGEDLER